MLLELNIEKYRGINNLKLDNLGKVNIIAGENNTGKTSILEVIESLEGPNDLRLWRSIGRRIEKGTLVGISTFDTIRTLFPVNNDGNTLSISYSGKLKEKNFSVQINGIVSDVILTDTQLQGLNGYRYAENRGEYGHREYETVELDIEYKLNNRKSGEDKLLGIVGGMPESKHKKKSVVNNVIYVSPTQHATNALYLNALMTNSELYEQFVEIMKEFDPDFISINSVDDEKTLSRKYMVLSKRFKEGLLLNAYGDGMKKAMLLLSAVIRAKDGILLLDEFETAIHVSVMGKVFKWIMETAEKLNVQIFMTSHSREAIETVLKCCPDMQKDIKMITLVNTYSGVKVRNVDAEKAIQLMDEYGLELR